MAEIKEILHGFKICCKTDAHFFRLCQTIPAYTCFHYEVRECAVTISTSSGPSAPVVGNSFGVLVEF